jgi:hypothetical protein
MGHYDDIIEDREDREKEALAKEQGITVNQLYENNRHYEDMQRGHLLWKKRKIEDDAIKYYLDNDSWVLHE